jgi:hypothetical protein
MPYSRRWGAVLGQLTYLKYGMSRHYGRYRMILFARRNVVDFGDSGREGGWWFGVMPEAYVVDTSSTPWGLLGETGTAQCLPVGWFLFLLQCERSLSDSGNLESFLLNLVNEKVRCACSLFQSRRQRGMSGRLCPGTASIASSARVGSRSDVFLDSTGRSFDSSTPTNYTDYFERADDGSVTGD